MRVLAGIFAGLIVLVQYPLWLGKGGWLKVWDIDRQVSEQKVRNEKLMVRNASLDAARARGREVLTDDPSLGDGMVEATALDDLTTAEDGARLRACLGQLEDKPRQGILLAFVHGLSHPEVAERMAQPLGTVKSWIRRGLLSLRECLA